MSLKPILVAVTLFYSVVVSPEALAQVSGIALAIDKHARHTEAGAIVVTIQIACGPFAGVEDFQETVAGAVQQKRNAEGEGGIDGTVVCDGVQRTHTASLSPFTDAGFRRGAANANAVVMVCMLVTDEQVCFSGGSQRRVIIRGRTLSQ